MTVEIRIMEEDGADKWDAIIAKSPYGSLFHTWKWLNITEKHTDTVLYPIMGIKEDTPVGVFPLFLQKKGPFRMVFSPPPHAALFYLGPVLIGCERQKQDKRETIYTEFQESVDRYISNRLNAHYISISLPPALQDPRPFSWSGYSIIPSYDYVIDLSVGPDALFSALDKKQRQNLTRSKKRGITVEIGGKMEFEAILDLMEIRYRQQGKVVPVSRNYYQEIYDAFEQNFRIFVAKVDNEIVSGNIDFQYKDRHYSWIGNPRPEKVISPSPNDILIWESVRCACEQGCKNYITMNAAGNKRYHSYYASKFNPALQVHFTVKKSSVFIGLLEKTYSDYLKPLNAKMKIFHKR